MKLGGLFEAVHAEFGEEEAHRKQDKILQRKHAFVAMATSGPSMGKLMNKLSLRLIHAELLQT